jgi:hypothetical protein
MALLSVQFINVDYFRWGKAASRPGGICGEAHAMYAAAENTRIIPP